MKNSPDLGSCIRIEERRVARRVTLPHQVWFELNPATITRLDYLRRHHLDLKLKPEYLVDLRYYALVNSGLMVATAELNPQPGGMTFVSNYRSSSQEYPVAGIRSRISLSGQVSQEIQQQLWQQPELSRQIIAIHYWLIEQIFQQLPVTRNNYFAPIIWSLWVAIAIILAWWFWFGLSIPLGVKAMLTVTNLFLLKKLLNYLIKIKLQNWAMAQPTSSPNSHQTYRRQLALWLMSH